MDTTQATTVTAYRLSDLAFDISRQPPSSLNQSLLAGFVQALADELVRHSETAETSQG